MPFFIDSLAGRCAVFIPLTPLRQTRQIRPKCRPGPFCHADEAIKQVGTVVCILRSRWGFRLFRNPFQGWPRIWSRPAFSNRRCGPV